MRLSDLAREVIETTVACGYDNRLSTFERVVVGVGSGESFDPEGRDRASLEETIEQAFARHEAAATTWPEPTDCDRLRRAFEALNADGIVIDAAAGGGLWLSFAALPADTEGWETRSAALGRELAELLEAHGLSWEWSGSARERLLVRPFTWQRRRWTTPPEVELRTPRAFVPTRAPVEGPPSDRGLGEVVVGLVNEGGYELRRARRFREAWQAAGHPGPAQVGHLGKPHAFVRAGERTTMMPVSAFANVVAAAGARDVAAAWPPPK